MRFFGRLFPYVLRYRLRFGVGLLALTAASVIALLTPLVIGEAVDDLRGRRVDRKLAPVRGPDDRHPGGRQRAPVRHARLRQRLLPSRWNTTCGTTCMSHIQSLDQKFFHENQTGDLMARVSNDVTTVREILGPGLMDLFRSILLFLAGLRDHAHNRCEARAARGGAAAAHHAAVRLGRGASSRSATTPCRRSSATSSTFVQENFSGARVVKAYVQEENEADAFERAGDRVRAGEPRLGASLDGALADADRADRLSTVDRHLRRRAPRWSRARSRSASSCSSTATSCCWRSRW